MVGVLSRLVRLVAPGAGAVVARVPRSYFYAAAAVVVLFLALRRRWRRANAGGSAFKAAVRFLLGRSLRTEARYKPAPALRYTCEGESNKTSSRQDELAIEALRTLGSNTACKLLLSKELAGLEAVAPVVREALREGSDFVTIEEGTLVDDLEKFAAGDIGGAVARRLFRTRLLRGLRRPQGAMSVGVGGIVCGELVSRTGEGQQVLIRDVGDVKETFLRPIAPPPAPTAPTGAPTTPAGPSTTEAEPITIVSFSISPWFMLGVDSLGRTLTVRQEIEDLPEAGRLTEQLEQLEQEVRSAGAEGGDAAASRTVREQTSRINAQLQQIKRALTPKLRWEQVDQLKGVDAASVHSRFGQIYVVTKTGDVYAWGLASGDGTPAWACSVGLPEGPKNIINPVKISGAPGVDRFGFGRSPVRSVACGVSHAVFLGCGGEAFAVGQGHQGQLGFGGIGDSSVPIRMELPEGLKVRQAACGVGHTLLVSAAGEAWGCGNNSAGELPVARRALGAVPPGHPCAKNPWSFEVRPRLLDLLPAAADSDRFVTVQVACGFQSSFILGERGEVLFSGSVIGEKAPFGREVGADPKTPIRLSGLPRICEVEASLRVPERMIDLLTGLPFYGLTQGGAGATVEAVLFRPHPEELQEEGASFIWTAPGGPSPRKVLAAAPETEEAAADVSPLSPAGSPTSPELKGVVPSSGDAPLADDSTTTTPMPPVVDWTNVSAPPVE